MKDLIDEALDFIKSNAPPEGYFVGFSGGKDSIVVLDLVRRSGVKHEAWYSCTRIDPPEVVAFIRKHYPDVRWAYPKMTFYQGIVKKAPPLKFRRWCCDVLKKDPTKNNPLKHRIMGLRAEESRRRAAKPRIDYFARYKQHVYKPIFDWNEYHIWEYIQVNGLAYPALYDEGFERLGCVVCPYLMSSNQIRLLYRMMRWPGFYKAFEVAMEKWYDRDDRAKKESRLKSFPEYLHAYYRSFYMTGSNSLISSVKDAIDFKEFLS